LIDLLEPQDQPPLPPKCKNTKTKQRIFIRERVSEEGEKVICCEELGKYEGVFIGENSSIGCKHH